jgi:hypothetical protein
MLNAAPGESPTVSVNEIARLAAGDTIRMSQLLEATKHVATSITAGTRSI